MAEVFALIARSAWDGIAKPGRIGKADGAAGVTVELVDEIGLASVIAREGVDGADPSLSGEGGPKGRVGSAPALVQRPVQTPSVSLRLTPPPERGGTSGAFTGTCDNPEGAGKSLAAAVRAAYGVALPGVSRFEAGKEIGFIGTGPGQWLAVSRALTHEALAEDLAEKLAGLASVSDQSDGRAVLRLSGPRARDVLAKGIPLDFDPAAFKPGHAAATLAGHIGVQVWQVDEKPTYEIAVFRSMADSFWHWLSASAAEFGCEVSMTGRG